MSNIYAMITADGMIYQVSASGSMKKPASMTRCYPSNHISMSAEKLAQRFAHERPRRIPAFTADPLRMVAARRVLHELMRPQCSDFNKQAG